MTLIRQKIKLQACLKDIKIWMTCNFLQLNSDKVIVLGPKHLRAVVLNYFLSCPPQRTEIFLRPPN